MVGLAHRRLAIVDIQGGAQPMIGTDGHVLVFNGEIYNYPALRQELEQEGVTFRTHCDTEVILKLYERVGEGCVDRLNGMFAFAVWDPHRRKIFFARDRIGEKPFYWTEVDGRFIFGSEIKALLAHPRVRAEVNEDAIAPYLVNFVTPSPATLFRGIHKLPPAHCGVCSEDGIRVRKYWDLFGPRTSHNISLDVSTRRVRDMLDASVHSRLMADVPVGVLLSGGVDSSALVALLGTKASGIATFSVGFEDGGEIDERDAARAVARHFGTDHHEITVSEDDALRCLTTLIHHQDEPLADPVCVPLMFVCQLAREHGVPVVMAGEGSDELFWGYGRYRQILLRERWMRALLAAPAPLRRSAASLFPAAGRPRLRELLDGIARGRPNPMHMPLGLTRYQVNSLLVPRLRRSDGWCPVPLSANEDPIATLGWDTQEYEFGLRLPELLLMRIDRFSMAHSVEARVPFLDPDLVDFAYRLPFDQKFHRGDGKHVLKRAIADSVPDWVLRRPKQGFGAPVVKWFQAGFRPLVQELLESDGIRAYFDAEQLQSAYRPGAIRRNHLGSSLWYILNFALWHRHWIEHESIDQLVESTVSSSRMVAASSNPTMNIESTGRPATSVRVSG
jgi:asparagine synthase (glutamine-hydrolysing)